MLTCDWDPRPLMLESPTGTQCPGTTSDETATADKCNMPDCTVNNPPVNTLHVNNPRTLTLPTPYLTDVNTNDIHPTSQNNPSQLYDTLYPALLHQHSTLASLQHNLHPILSVTKSTSRTTDKLQIPSQPPRIPASAYGPTQSPKSTRTQASQSANPQPPRMLHLAY